MTVKSIRPAKSIRFSVLDFLLGLLFFLVGRLLTSYYQNVRGRVAAGLSNREINPTREINPVSVLDSLLVPFLFFLAGQMLTSSYQNVQGRVTAGFCNCRVSILSNEDRDTLQTLHLQDFWALSTSFHLFPDT